MTGLIKELVTDVIDTVLKEILKKTGIGTTTKRKRRQARTATGQFKKSAAPKARPAKKQVSRRRTAANRSKAARSRA